MSIKLKNITFKVTGKSRNWVVEDLEFKENTIYRLNGESGIGKSTFIELIKNRISKKHRFSINPKTYTGEIFYNDTLVNKNTNIKYSIVEQNSPFLENLTIRENLANSNNIEKFIDALSLNEAYKSDTKIKDLSGGERRRVAFLRSLISTEDSDIVIFDEPFNDLDKDNVLRICEIIKENNRLFIGKVIIVVTHIDEYYPMLVKSLGDFDEKSIKFVLVGNEIRIEKTE